MKWPITKMKNGMRITDNIILNRIVSCHAKNKLWWIRQNVYLAKPLISFFAFFFYIWFQWSWWWRSAIAQNICIYVLCSKMSTFSHWQNSWKTRKYWTKIRNNEIKIMTSDPIFGNPLITSTPLQFNNDVWLFARQIIFQVLFI